MVDFVGQLYGKTLGGKKGPLLVDLWREILRFAEKHVTAQVENAEVFDALSFEFLNDLKGVSSEDWSKMCHGIGPTVYGAVALSWCEDAELSQVWDGWRASEFPIKPLPEYERPARFINPGLLPPTNSLLAIVEFSANRPLPICAIIAALKEPLAFDMSKEQLSGASPQIAAFLKSRMLKKPTRSDEDEELIATWTAIVNGTDFDVWKDS